VIPLVVVQGSEASFRAAKVTLERRGWLVVQGWNSTFQKGRGSGPSPAGRSKIVRTGTVSTRTDAANAVLTALGGQGVLIAANAEHTVLDTLCDDLARLGPVDFRSGEDQDAARVLSDDDLAILRLLLRGLTLGQVAAAQHVSRRTLDRRMAGIRRTYDVARNAEALTAARRRGDL